MRTANNWLITVYDSLYRPVQTRMYNTTTPFATLLANAAGNPFYPGQVGTLLTQTHYDDYTGVPSGLSGTLSSTGGWSGQFPATSNATFPYPQMPVQSTATKGLVTWTQTAIVDSTPAAYIYTVNIYDDKDRVIQTQGNNITGGLDVVTTEYTWAGQPYWMVESHQKSGANPLTTTIWTQNNYDQAGRVTSNLEKFNTNATWDTMSIMIYDALGQVEKKLLGQRRSAVNIYTATPMETQDYQYNSRGWLLGMNRAYTRETSTTHTTTNTTTTQVMGGEMFTESMQDEETVTYPNTRFFGFDLGYDKISGVLINRQSYTAAQYNGNIAGMAWKNVYDSCVRKYDFTYDAVNRLTGADFNQYTGTTFNKTAKKDYSVSNLGYDNNGNILSMTQKGLLPTVDTSNTIDQLTYTYNTGSNKLAKVADAAPIDSAQHLGDFQDGVNSGNDYAYDVNGNLTSDLNKKIGLIIYNYLNLPEIIRVTGKGSIYYTYDASGIKLRKKTVDSTALPAKVTTTLYIDNAVYQNDTLQFFGTNEGRARPNSTVTGGFVFDYFLKDHLGNTRMVITDDYNVSSAVLEATNYYPFGLTMAGISSKALNTAPENKYKLFGKELQNKEFSDGSGLEWYDYGMREYDQQLGRFFRVDPITERFYELSPYQYCFNNPIKNVDLDGLEGLNFNLFNRLIENTVKNPNGTSAKVLGAVIGVGGAVTGVVTGTANAIRHPIQTGKGLMRMLSQTPEQNAADYAVNVTSQYVGTGSDAFTNYAIGAHMLTDIAIALSPMKEFIPGGGKSIWELAPSARGFAAEKILGGNLPDAFPVIDKFADGVATSIKSIDLTAASYNKGNGLLNTLKGYVNKLDNFNGKTFDGVTINGSDITSKVLDVAVQPGKASLSQWEQIGKAMQYAKDNNIQFNLQFIK